jgi:hypothetical protein
MRHLNHDASTVSCIVLTPASAPVFHVFKDGKRVGNDLVGLIAFDVCNKTNATGIMLKLRRI